MVNDEENHALVADKETPTEFSLMAKTSAESEAFDNSLCSKACKKNSDSLNRLLECADDTVTDYSRPTLTIESSLDDAQNRNPSVTKTEASSSTISPKPFIKFVKANDSPTKSKTDKGIKNIASLKKKLETLNEEKEGVDGKLAGLLKASKDLDNLIESQRPSPTVESTSGDDQNKNSSKTIPSPITPKPFIKFMKPKDSQSKSKSGKTESPKKPPVKYAEQYRKPNKKPNDRGNQKNWNNLKTHQLGPDFVMKKKACFNCGDFNHLAYDCRKRAHLYANRPFHRTSAVRSPHRAPWVPTVNRNFPPVNRKFSPGSRNFSTGNRKFPTASRKFPTGRTKCSTADIGMKGKAGSSQNNINDKGYWDSGCSRHMIGNISYLSDYEPFDGGYVSFGQGGCKITGKGTIKTGKLEFENVYFVKDLKYNLFSVSQIYDNKNIVLFTDSECIVLERDFKLLDDANILLRTLKQHNMYSIDLNNIIPHRDLTCLVAKASADEYMLWHRRLGHLNFKTMNKLVRHNLVRGLPTKCFENDHTCTACLKGKQHKASCKYKLVNSVSKPLHTLHMDVFGPTSVSSISHKWYCLVVTDDFSRFTWTFFLKSKDDTSGILKKFIIEIENLKDLKVEIIRCDNGGEFRNKEMNDFCSQKGIKREFSNARTPQQNGVTKRRNRTLIKAARTMLADAKLPITFWAKAVNTACYVQNRVLVNKSHNKTPYELFNGRSPAIGFLKPFGCHVMILNILDNLRKFKEKGD
nr:putative ribonuclease H-like domain-containing protein [Tanacetum cinerariifolium]